MVDALTDKERLPSVIAKNIEICYTELGVAKLRIIAPETRHYKYAEEPYTEFPLGITVYTFDDSLQVESQLTANYAIYYEEKKTVECQARRSGKEQKGRGVEYRTAVLG